MCKRTLLEFSIPLNHILPALEAHQPLDRDCTCCRVRQKQLGAPT